MLEVISIVLFLIGSYLVVDDIQQPVDAPVVEQSR